MTYVVYLIQPTLAHGFCMASAAMGMAHAESMVMTAFTSSVNVVVVCLGEPADSVLVQLSQERGWRMICTTDLADALKQTFALVPHVFVVQVGRSPQSAVELIRLLRRRRSLVPVIASCGQGGREVEHMVRRAGASGCVFTVAGPDHLLRMIAGIGQTAGRARPSLRQRLAVVVRQLFQGGQRRESRDGERR